jgi:hypothetical protein
MSGLIAILQEKQAWKCKRKKTSEAQALLERRGKPPICAFSSFWHPPKVQFVLMLKLAQVVIAAAD